MMKDNLKKQLIIDRLLKTNYITPEEAEILCEENYEFIPYIPNLPELQIEEYYPIQPPNFPNIWMNEELERRMNYAKNCQCNPANGGSGMCGCTMASPVIYT